MKIDKTLNLVGDVLIGDEDELYLAGGNHSILKFAQGADLPAACIDNLSANLEFRCALANRYSTPFAHIIAPEKYVVYSDDFPIKNAGSMARQYLDAGRTGVIYPVELLKSDKTERTYFRTDTHWAPHGLLRISSLIASVAGLSESVVAEGARHLASQLCESEDTFYGDLGRKLAPQRGEPRLTYRPSTALTTVENGIGHDFAAAINDGRLIVQESREPLSEKRLLIFGDSYLFHAIPFLGVYFRRVVFLRTRFVHEEIIQQVAPSVIISQMAERYLTRVDLDETAPPFAMIPFLLGRTQNISREDAKIFARALSGGRDVSTAVFER